MRMMSASTRVHSTMYKLLILLAISILLSLCVGAYSLSLGEIFNIFFYSFSDNSKVETSSSFLIFQIRLPRIVLGLLVGIGLAISGAAVQIVFRNPLADPGLIGISSGAMLFAASFIVVKDYAPFQWNELAHYLGLSIAAFLGALLSTIAVYQLSTQDGRTYISTMLLAGVAMTALAGGLTGLLIFYANEAQLRDITFWNLGSVSGANWRIVGWLAFVVSFGMYKILKYAKQLEIMQLGDQEALYLGVSIERVKREIIAIVVLVVGTTVAFTGMIGFVGLVVPHLVRIYYKNTSFYTNVLYTAVVGGVLIIGADTLARTMVAPAELPIGIITALIGAPFFLWLLVNNKNKY